MREADRPRVSNLGSVLASAGLVFVSALARADVVIDRDPAVDFSAFSTFAWLDGTVAEEPRLEKHIRVAVERELVAQGFKEERNDPDLLILTHSAMDETRTIEVGDYPYWSGYEGWKKPVAVGIESFELVAGTFIVDILEASSERLIWRGLATGTVAKKSEKRDHKINQAAANMFKRFRPD